MNRMETFSDVSPIYFRQLSQTPEVQAFRPGPRPLSGSFEKGPTATGELESANTGYLPMTLEM
jgi:hypothetical protein